jgi:hypothetical protein
VASKKSASNKRRPLDPLVRLKVWVRCGGRCVICNRYLLEGQLTGREVTFGELAHIVGQQVSELSPRGLDEELDPDGRDDLDNLMLVCEDEHRELDKMATRDLFSVTTLRDRKRRHEERIRHLTSFTENQFTVVLRMIGRLRGSAVEVDRDAAAAAIIAAGRHFPRFDLAYDRHGIEIDLRNIVGEPSADEAYYREAVRAIDDVMSGRVADGLRKGDIRHLSVFAFGRLPLLVHLGARLDDTVPVEVYQRHRDDSWVWKDQEPVSFEARLPGPGTGSEGVLIVNVSGSIHPHELPPELQALPLLELRATAVTPHPGLIGDPRSLAAFEATVRGLLAGIEAQHKDIQLLHTFLAIPLSTAVTLGRTHDPAVHPALRLYDRTDNGYRPAIEIGTQ